MNQKTECTKCEKWFNYELSYYGRRGEDTFDFELCHTCEKKLWGKFLPIEAGFNWEDEE